MQWSYHEAVDEDSGDEHLNDEDQADVDKMPNPDKDEEYSSCSAEHC